MLRTWSSVLRAVQHPTYTAPALKPTLLARVPQLHSCADAYPLRTITPAPLGTSVPINGTLHDLTPAQRDFATALAKDLQIDSTEAAKVVLQQSRLGVVDVDGVEKAYMAERTDLLRVVRSLLGLTVNGSENVTTMELAGEIVAKLKDKEYFATKLVDGLRKRVEEALPAKAIANVQSSLVWSRQILVEEHEILEMLVYVTENGNVSSEVVTAWFKMLEETHFFSNQRNVRSDTPLLSDMIQTVQALAAVLSVRFTSLPETELGILAKDKGHYFSDPAAVIKVHESIKLLAPQGPHLLLAPAALAWALTMHQLFNALTEDDEELPPSHVQALVRTMFDQADVQTKLFETGEGVVEWHRFFAQLAFERGAFDVIAAISTSLFPTTGSKTVSCDKQIHEIFQNIFFSSFHMIPFNDSVVSAFQAIHNTSPELSHLFWQAAQSDTATPASDLLFAVRSRFPLSFLPLLQILTSSLHATTRDTIFNFFQSLPTYTQTLQRGFTGYDIIEEERDNTLISLKSDLRVFSERDDGEGAVIVQTGTVGRLLSRGESVPTVMWEWPFNGWALLGRVLETVLANGVAQVVAADESYMPILTAIFGFLARAMDGGAVAGVVAATSEEMAQEWDVVSVTWEMVAQVLEVLDIGTITHVDVVNLLRLAEAGMGVLTAAVKGREASIWSLIVRGGTKWWGRLARVGITAEMACQEVCMPLTMSGVSFLDALFSAAVRNIVLSDGFSVHLRKEVLAIAGTYATDVWINFNDWKYTVGNRRFEIGTKLCRMFNRIVSEVYTIDAAHGPENRITGVLAPTADRILEMFLSLDEDITRPFEALFYACYVTKEILVNIEEGVDQGWVTQAEDWAKEALYLANTVVRTRPIVNPDFLKFEVHIFSQLKMLNILLTTSPALRIPTFTLLQTLLSVPQPRIQPGEHEQASILAHLRGDEKYHIPLVIDIVTDPLMDPEIRASVWRYASSVMGSYQQGLAILLLFGEETGRRTANKPAVVEDKEEKETFLRKAITMVVEDDLEFKHLLERQVFVEFLSKAHNSWAPILSTVRQDKALWAKLLILLSWSGIIVDTTDSPDRTLQNCWRLRTAAAAVDAIAVEIFHAGSLPNAASISVLRDHFVTKKDINVPRVANEAFRVRGYRDSLFFHLRRNFQKKFPTADILRFQRSTGRDRAFGDDYFFDLEIGRDVFGDDAAWEAFEREIRLANLNMSMVDAQLELLAAWQHLALAWDENGQKALPLEGRSVSMAKACLEANISEAKLHALLQVTMINRANLAFSLIGNPTMTVKHEEVKTILRLAFNALVAPELNFFDSLTDGRFDLARPCLRVIATCLKRCDRSKDKSPKLLLDMFEAIVAKGGTNLCNRARMQPGEDVAEMINIVIAISQEILDLCATDLVNTEFCNKLMDHNSIETAIRLYASSHDALVDDQPIFAELSFEYLVTLCSAPRVPEQIAVNGIIPFIMESPMSSVLQTTDIHNIHHHLLHQVWTRGILPIIFNLLQSLGTRILRDAISFLRLYEPQIQAAFTEWARPKCITTTLVDETLLLLVLFEVVDTYSRIEQDRFVFRGKEDLLENVNNLLAHPRYLARLTHPTTFEEQVLAEERLEGEFKNGLVAKISMDLEEVRGLLGVSEQ